MRTLKIFLLILLVVLVGAALRAQDEEAEACDYAALAARLTEVGEGLEASEDPAADLMALQAEISTLQASCSGLSFNSEAEGMQPVIGPIEIPEGLYRVIMTTDGYAIVDIEPLEGTCGPRGFGTNVFLLSDGDAAAGAESVAQSEGCEALLIIDNTTAEWSITFEKIR